MPETLNPTNVPKSYADILSDPVAMYDKRAGLNGHNGNGNNGHGPLGQNAQTAPSSNGVSVEAPVIESVNNYEGTTVNGSENTVEKNDEVSGNPHLLTPEKVQSVRADLKAIYEGRVPESLSLKRNWLLTGSEHEQKQAEALEAGKEQLFGQLRAHKRAIDAGKWHDRVAEHNELLANRKAMIAERIKDMHLIGLKVTPQRIAEAEKMAAEAFPLTTGPTAVEILPTNIKEIQAKKQSDYAEKIRSFDRALRNKTPLESSAEVQSTLFDQDAVDASLEAKTKLFDQDELVPESLLTKIGTRLDRARGKLSSLYSSAKQRFKQANEYGEEKLVQLQNYLTDPERRTRKNLLTAAVGGLAIAGTLYAASKMGGAHPIIESSSSSAHGVSGSGGSGQIVERVRERLASAPIPHTARHFDPNQLPWDAAEKLDPEHPIGSINAALREFNAREGTKYALDSFGRIADGQRIFNEHQVRMLNEMLEQQSKKVA